MQWLRARQGVKKSNNSKRLRVESPMYESMMTSVVTIQDTFYVTSPNAISESKRDTSEQSLRPTTFGVRYMVAEVQY